MESYQPDYLHADPVDIQPDHRAKSTNPLVGRRILIGGKTYYKGYVGYVRSVAEGVAHLELDANHRIECLPFKDIIDL